MNINIIDEDTIEIEILSGHVYMGYSGGQHFANKVNLIPEKRTLIYRQGLTKEEFDLQFANEE